MGTKVATRYMKMERNDSSLFFDLKQALINEFEGLGISRNNFNVFWQDEDNDYVEITNNNGVIIALDQLVGTVYKLFVRLTEDGKASMYTLIFCFCFWLITT